jgi:hypothetical protein
MNWYNESKILYKLSQFDSIKQKPWHITSNEYDTIFSLAGEIVDGRKVRQNIPNYSSIDSSLENYTVANGIKEIPMDVFADNALPISFYSLSEEKRTKNLAKEIHRSQEISPLIVVYDSKGLYILEGGHRFDALKILQAQSIPALLVFDEDDLYNAVKNEVTSGKQVPMNILQEYPDLLQINQQRDKNELV